MNVWVVYEFEPEYEGYDTSVNVSIIAVCATLEQCQSLAQQHELIKEQGVPMPLEWYAANYENTIYRADVKGYGYYQAEEFAYFEGMPTIKP